MQLKDYLESLLGSSSIQDDERIKIFLTNLASFQRGVNDDSSFKLFPSSKKVDSFTQQEEKKNEPPKMYSSSSNKTKTSKTKLPARKPTPKTTARANVILQTNDTQATERKQMNSSMELNKNNYNGVSHHQGRDRDSPNKLDTARKSSATESTTTAKDPPPKKDIEKNNKTKKPAPKLPQKGKAKYNCGCFGTKHKALANCLHCGRIICQKEGFGYCPFCGFLITQSSVDKKKTDGATLHKERLLQFDREFTKRTVIYDAQSDYYHLNSSWLNETERSEQLQKEEERRQLLHDRQKQKLQIQFE